MGDQVDNPSSNEGAGNILKNARVTAGGQIVNDIGLWDRVLLGWVFIEQYGWYLLLGTILLIYILYKLQPKYYAWIKKREKWTDEQNYDPVQAERNVDAMMRARERMQRELDEQAVLHEAKKQERENREKEERIKQWEQFKVVSTSKAKRTAGNTNTRRNYLPLGGQGSGGGYRPSRRQVGGGG